MARTILFFLWYFISAVGSTISTQGTSLVLVADFLGLEVEVEADG
jgi:hypothetical protein